MTELRYDKADLHEAIETLKNGGIILYPTDTVWGIGCDARNEEAVKKIFEIKQREDTKSMLVLLDEIGKIQGYVSEIPDTAWDLIEFATKPLTIIYPGARNLAKNLIAADGTIGIRVSTEPFSKALCAGIHGPIVSTSANISGQPTAKYFAEIADEIKEKVDYICKFRQDDTTEKEPSSIIKLGPGSLIKIIRQ